MRKDRLYQALATCALLAFVWLVAVVPLLRSPSPWPFQVQDRSTAAAGLFSKDECERKSVLVLLWKDAYDLTEDEIRVIITMACASTPRDEQNRDLTSAVLAKAWRRSEPMLIAAVLDEGLACGPGGRAILAGALQRIDERYAAAGPGVSLPDPETMRAVFTARRQR